MSFSYGSDPSHSNLDAVRFLIQDTTESSAIVADEEIEFLLATEANIYMAAATVCELLVTRAKGVRSKTISEFRISYDWSVYERLAAAFRARGSMHQVPYFGGQSVSDKLAQQTDTNAVAPAFTTGQADNPGGAKPTVNPPDPLTTI